MAFLVVPRMLWFKHQSVLRKPGACLAGVRPRRFGHFRSPCSVLLGIVNITTIHSCLRTLFSWPSSSLSWPNLGALDETDTSIRP
jgi:hypothetical protein